MKVLTDIINELNNKDIIESGVSLSCSTLYFLDNAAKEFIGIIKDNIKDSMSRKVLFRDLSIMTRDCDNNNKLPMGTACDRTNGKDIVNTWDAGERFKLFEYRLCSTYESPSVWTKYNRVALRWLYISYNGFKIVCSCYAHTKVDTSTEEKTARQRAKDIDLKYFSNIKIDKETKDTDLKVYIELDGLTDDEKSIVNDYVGKKSELKINRAISKYKGFKNSLSDEEINSLQDELKDQLHTFLNESVKFTKLPKQYLTEANRQQLLQKSRNAKHYKDTTKGKNRYERRMKSKISATVKDYNNIQMDQLFKRDIFEIKIPVLGETDVYEVHVKVEGILSEVQKQVQSNKGKLEFKVILQSLMKVLNVGDVYIGCTCPDFTYRQRYWATRNNYVAGGKETRASNVTNPHDDLGAGCKHVMLILANLDWCVKCASVINNYIKYCQEHLEQAYADYIFPKVYGIKYQKALQLDMFYDGMLPDDKKTKDQITQQSLQGRDNQGKFKQENPFAFKKKDLRLHPEDNPNQLKLDLETPKNKELKVDGEIEDEQ